MVYQKVRNLKVGFGIWYPIEVWEVLDQLCVSQDDQVALNSVLEFLIFLLLSIPDEVLIELLLLDEKLNPQILLFFLPLHF